MLSDTRGVYGALARGHERDEEGLSDDALFKRYQRQDSLWDSSELNVRSELGFTNYDNMPTEAERLRRALAKAPQDLAYSSYHRHSELGILLRNAAPERRWDPLEGIDRYWPEHKAEARESGDFETKRLSEAPVPKEGQVRIVVPHMEKGHETLGLGIVGLRVVQIVDPKAYEIGWRVGDEVLKVNRVPVADGLQFKEAITRAISRNHLTASPLLFDVWREPLRSVHHGPHGVAPFGTVPRGMPPGIPMGHPASSMGLPYPGAPMMLGAPMIPAMPGPPFMMSAPAGGLQHRLAALAQENAHLREQLGEGPNGGGRRLC